MSSNEDVHKGAFSIYVAVDREVPTMLTRLSDIEHSNVVFLLQGRAEMAIEASYRHCNVKYKNSGSSLVTIAFNSAAGRCTEIRTKSISNWTVKSVSQLPITRFPVQFPGLAFATQKASPRPTSGGPAVHFPFS